MAQRTSNNCAIERRVFFVASDTALASTRVQEPTTTTS
jgi:hypothetical protein